MSLIKNVARVAGQVRQISTTSVVRDTPIKYAPICPKFQAKQKLFQADNDLPVHLKGGFGDMVLYRLTAALTIVGVGWSMSYIIKSAYKEFH